jgi:hypothetical protein
VQRGRNGVMAMACRWSAAPRIAARLTISVFAMVILQWRAHCPSQLHNEVVQGTFGVAL